MAGYIGPASVKRGALSATRQKKNMHRFATVIVWVQKKGRGPHKQTRLPPPREDLSRRHAPYTFCCFTFFPTFLLSFLLTRHHARDTAGQTGLGSSISSTAALMTLKTRSCVTPIMAPTACARGPLTVFDLSGSNLGEVIGATSKLREFSDPATTSTGTCMHASGSPCFFLFCSHCY